MLKKKANCKHLNLYCKIASLIALFFVLTSSVSYSDIEVDEKSGDYLEFISTSIDYADKKISVKAEVLTKSLPPSTCVTFIVYFKSLEYSIIELASRRAILKEGETIIFSTEAEGHELLPGVYTFRLYIHPGEQPPETDSFFIEKVDEQGNKVYRKWIIVEKNVRYGTEMQETEAFNKIKEFFTSKVKDIEKYRNEMVEVEEGLRKKAKFYTKNGEFDPVAFHNYAKDYIQKFEKLEKEYSEFISKYFVIYYQEDLKFRFANLISTLRALSYDFTLMPVYEYFAKKFKENKIEIPQLELSPVKLPSPVHCVYYIDREVFYFNRLFGETSGELKLDKFVLPEKEYPEGFEIAPVSDNFQRLGISNPFFCKENIDSKLIEPLTYSDIPKTYIEGIYWLKLAKFKKKAEDNDDENEKKEEKDIFSEITICAIAFKDPLVAEIEYQKQVGKFQKYEGISGIWHYLNIVVYQISKTKEVPPEQIFHAKDKPAFQQVNDYYKRLFREIGK